jgi:hypothetical protein
MSAPTLTWGPKDLPVPNAAPWSGERLLGADTLRIGPHKLWYRDEKPTDRDRNGVLWARYEQQPGTGRPNFAAMHPTRQRTAMLGLHCQVCNGPADRTPKGVLFLLGRDEAAHQPEGALTSKPPVCAPCADLALRMCPHLHNCTAVRSRKPRVWGVSGELFHPKGQLPGAVTLPYGDPALHWVLATQIVLELTRCTVAHLDHQP